MIDRHHERDCTGNKEMNKQMKNKIVDHPVCPIFDKWEFHKERRGNREEKTDQGYYDNIRKYEIHSAVWKVLMRT